ncbi:ABC transporter permease [Paraburkholderia bannensis]|uniref:ABC transporter permease n=1 Tax=Paraburkholderia bannensis TaxID=765414 RepID=UPI002AB754FB|nr:ABC transporter permease [Paraburkholderia bannensis]
MKEAQVHASGYGSHMSSAERIPLLRRIGGGRLKAVALVLPLAVFLFVFFALPLYNVLKTAVVNDAVKVGLPRTSVAISKWDGKADVSPALQGALLADVAAGSNDQERMGDAVRQLNADLPGFRSLMAKTQRAVSNADGDVSSVKLADVDDRWTDLSFWRTIKRDSHVLTDNNLLAALDMHRDASGEVESLPDGTSANRLIIGRTFLVAFLVTLVCVLIGVPYALIASRVTGWRRSVMLTMVLIPLWTSLLVRSAAWVVILQDHGIINDTLIAVGAITHPIQLIYNRVGVLLAMSQVLLPFMVLPVYSAIQAVPKNLMPAASSLGAKPVTAFVKVLLPLILSGIVSGALLVFMSAIGYYITPTLVGGAGDQMISSVIAFYATGTADWGRAAALGLILLCATLVLYVAYARVSKSNALMGE